MPRSVMRTTKRFIAVLTASLIALTAAVTSVSPATAAPMFMIRGTVTGLDGEPASHVLVLAYAKVGTEWQLMDGTNTDDDGAWTVVSETGKVRLTAYDASRDFTRGLGRTELTTTGPTTGVGIRLAPVESGAVTGSSTLADTNESATDQGVLAYENIGTPDEPSWVVLSGVPVGVDGTYRLSLPVGTYRIEFRAPEGYASMTYPEGSTLASAEDVTVTAGETLNGIDGLLRRIPTFGGVVTGPDGEPATEVEVKTWRRVGTADAPRWTPAGVTGTDEEGRYSFRGEAGTYRFKFIDAGARFAWEYLGDATDFTSSASTVIEPDSSRTDVNARLEPRDERLDTAITGTVTKEADETPLADAYVAAVVEDVPPSELEVPAGTSPEEAEMLGYSFAGDEGRTGADGTFTLPLQSGDYRLVVAEESLTLEPEYYDDASTFVEATTVAATAAHAPHLTVGLSAPTIKPRKAPVISGEPVMGLKLSVSKGTWTKTPTSYTYQWFADDAPIVGATRSTFTPDVRHLGAAITVLVAAKRRDALSGSAMSAPTGPVTASEVVILTRADLRGTPSVGGTLTVVPPVIFPASAGITYQWLADGKPIPGATGRTLRPTGAQTGRQVRTRVFVTATGLPTERTVTPATTVVTVKPTVALTHTWRKKRKMLTLRIMVTAAGRTSVPGRVRVSRGGKTMATAKLASPGVATITLRKPPRGVRKYTVTYEGSFPVLPATTGRRIKVTR